MNNRSRNMLWGLLFIVLGVGYAGNALWNWNFSIFFPGWWTLFIIIPCLSSMLQSGVKVGNSIGLMIGVLFFISNYFDLDFLGKLIVPIALVIVGLVIIFGNSFSRRDSDKNTYKDNDVHYEGYISEMRAIFSSKSNNYNNEVFRGVDVSAIFGNVRLDLKSADIVDESIIEIFTIFGSVDIYAPDDIEIIVSQIPIIGGVNYNQNTNNTTMKIYVNATCVLGGVNIRQ